MKQIGLDFQLIAENAITKSQNTLLTLRRLKTTSLPPTTPQTDTKT